MLARTDALMSQAETGKIALRPSSPWWPVVTRRMLPTNGIGSIRFQYSANAIISVSARRLASKAADESWETSWNFPGWIGQARTNLVVCRWRGRHAGAA